MFLATSSCEEATVPRLSADDVEIEEGNSTFDIDFYVYLTEPASKKVIVDYTTSGVSAIAGEDFEFAQGVLEIEKGETTGLISLTILGDVDPEGTESFWISFSNPQNVTIPEPYAQITLKNDDGAPPIDNTGYTSPSSYSGYSLIWEEEFDGSSLDLSVWNYETGASGWGNNESQYYRSGNKNAELDQGFLRITAKEETHLGAPYTSARLTTQGKESFQYGRIDIRAKVPYGQGVWPALWMLGDNFSSAGWPTCGEIDIMELIGGEGYNDRTVYGTAHWSNNGSHAEYGGNRSLPLGEKFNDEFHVFSIIWSPSSIKWLRDDIQYHIIDINNLSAFHNNFFFIFNVAVGGNWPGSPDASTIFPQTMIVDYVRVFQ